MTHLTACETSFADPLTPAWVPSLMGKLGSPNSHHRSGPVSGMIGYGRGIPESADPQKQPLLHQSYVSDMGDPTDLTL